MEEPMQFDIRSLMSAGFWFAFLLWFVIILIPVVRLLKRTGHHTAWSLLFVIPLVNVIALWIFAFKSWPTDRKPASA
jgi:membrane protein DedA with SNARE-associated domain